MSERKGSHFNGLGLEIKYITLEKNEAHHWTGSCIHTWGHCELCGFSPQNNNQRRGRRGARKTKSNSTATRRHKATSTIPQGGSMFERERGKGAMIMQARRRCHRNTGRACETPSLFGWEKKTLCFYTERSDRCFGGWFEEKWQRSLLLCFCTLYLTRHCVFVCVCLQDLYILPPCDGIPQQWYFCHFQGICTLPEIPAFSHNAFQSRFAGRHSQVAAELETPSKIHCWQLINIVIRHENSFFFFLSSQYQR